MKVGDQVRFKHRRPSALDGGPGVVMSLTEGLTGATARVRILTPCKVLGNAITRGEVLLFMQVDLEVIEDAPAVAE